MEEIQQFVCLPRGVVFGVTPSHGSEHQPVHQCIPNHIYNTSVHGSHQHQQQQGALPVGPHSVQHISVLMQAPPNEAIILISPRQGLTTGHRDTASLYRSSKQSSIKADINIFPWICSDYFESLQNKIIYLFTANKVKEIRRFIWAVSLSNIPTGAYGCGWVYTACGITAYIFLPSFMESCNVSASHNDIYASWCIFICYVFYHFKNITRIHPRIFL